MLDEIAKILIEEEKIDGKQLLLLVKKIRPDLVTEKAMAAIDRVITPTGTPTPALQEASWSSWDSIWNKTSVVVEPILFHNHIVLEYMASNL